MFWHYVTLLPCRGNAIKKDRAFLEWLMRMRLVNIDSSAGAVSTVPLCKATAEPTHIYIHIYIYMYIYIHIYIHTYLHIHA